MFTRKISSRYFSKANVMKTLFASPIVEHNGVRVSTLLGGATKWSRITAFALVSSLILSTAAQARVRAMHFYFEQVESTTVNASANGRGCTDPSVRFVDSDQGTMIYQTSIDQGMIDQLNAVLDVGGSAKIVFTLRKAFSVVGAGSARIEGEVTVTVGGTTVATITDSGETPPGGTFSNQYEIPIDSSIVAGMSDGGSITVNASGVGEAYANVCGSINQAIATWYFTNGGKPFLATSPY